MVFKMVTGDGDVFPPFIVVHGLRLNTEILHSLSDKHPWERYEPPYSPSYRLNSITTTTSIDLVSYPGWAEGLVNMVNDALETMFKGLVKALEDLKIRG